MRRLFPLLLLFLTLPVGAIPAERTSEQVEVQIRRLADQVADIAGKQRGILDRVLFLKKRIRLDETQLLRIAAIRKDTLAKLASTGKEINEISRREQEVAAYLKARMRQQYALGILQQYRVYFAVNSTQDLRSAGVYLQALARMDAQRLAELQTLHAKREAARAALDELRLRLEKQAAEASKERKTMAGEQKKLALVLSNLAERKETARLGLEEKISAARKMDSYIKDLAFRSKVDVYSKNIEKRRGKLDPPCRGRVIKKFGDYVDPRFGTRTPHPGIDIAAPLGTPVHAVFDGIVKYADWLTGYGYTVILRHPGGYFSTYAHLDRVVVHKGDTVGSGETLGTVGDDPSTSTTSLYFEMREGGTAVSPSKWLKRSPR